MKRNVIVSTMQYVHIGLLSLSSVAYAGEMGTSSSFAGFSAGVGAGYSNVNIQLNTNATMHSSTSVVTEHFKEDQIKGAFSPVVNASYWYALPKDWLIGVKGVYKYLGAQESTLAWSGTFSDGTYQHATVYTRLDQELWVMMTGGYAFGPCMLYAGVGPGVTRINNHLQGELLPATSTRFQYSDTAYQQTLWGAAGQLGFLYMLPNRFVIDVSYNLVATPAKTMPTMAFHTGVSGEYTGFSQRSRVLNQGLNLTINKYFF